MTSETYSVFLHAENDAGFAISGTANFVIADVPETPDAPVNEADITDDTQIGVTFAETLPNERGSPIFAV
jgi:hypothetical protein